MSDKPKIILHNGNTSVMSRLSLENCYNIQDVPGNTIAEKAIYQQHKNISTHFCVADLKTSSGNDNSIVDQDLIEISNNFYICKTITSYVNDKLHLDPCWNSNYSKLQYLQNLAYGMSLCEEILFLDKPDLEFNKTTNENYIFSPGRCGSHLLMNQSSEFMSYKLYHHNQDNKNTLQIEPLCYGKKIVSIVRKNIFDQISSSFVSEILGTTMITTNKNYLKNKKIVDNAKPQPMPKGKCIQIKYQMQHFFDWFYLLQLVLEKDIELHYFEDLDKNVGKFLKNPYDKQILISNYADAEAYVNNIIQPFYNKLLNKKIARRYNCTFG